MYVAGDLQVHAFDGTNDTWNQMACDSSFYRVWGLTPTDVWAIGEYGDILHHN
jgi:hypothetical protein